MKNLDFHTASVIYVGCNICIAGMLAVAFSDSRERGAWLWIAGLLSQIVAVPLFALRAFLPLPVSIIGANGFFALSFACYQASFDVFFGRRRPVWFYGLPVFLSLSIAGVLLGEVRPRAVLLGALYAGQAWTIAVLLLERKEGFRRRVILMLSVGYFLAGLSFLVRAASVLLSTEAVPDPFASRPIQNLVMMLFVPSLIACTIGFVLLQRERVENEIRRLADTDGLTGLRNRRGFEALLEDAQRLAREEGAWMSLAVCDIDHFKTVNDRHGHAVGDEALAMVARIIGTEIRSNDWAARLGGDEFCVLLSHASPERAARVAERLRRAVAGYDWRAFGLDAPLTVTIGLSSYQGGGLDGWGEFLRLADMALIAGKGLARDTVLHADDLTAPSPRSRA